jgi:hypothetical protein
MLFALLIFLMSGFSAQDALSQEQPRPLKSSSIHVLQVPMFGAYGEPQCDEKMSTYYHLMAGPYRRTILLRVSASGEESTLYKLPDDFAESTGFMDFSVTPSGNVTALIEDSKGHAIAFQFNSEGEVASHVQLELPDHVAGEHIVVFPNGSMLFSGVYRQNAPPDLRGKKYAGVFQASGKLLKRLDSMIQEAKRDSEDSSRLPEGAVVVGTDGNAYLLGADKVFVVSASGQIQKKIPFGKPAPDFSTVRAQYSQGLLVITFAKPGKPEVIYRYLVIDASTGEPLGLYQPTPELGNSNVCFSRTDGFLFNKVEDGKTMLITAPLR